MAKTYDFFFKLLLVGDVGVGKTCVLSRYAGGTFNSTYIPATGVDVRIKTIELEGKRINLQIWDISAQERFHSTITSLYREAMGMILVYDITWERSFDNISRWLSLVKQHASPDVERLLIGSKCDLEEERVVESKRGEQLARSQGIPFMETSAKTNHNIDEAFEVLVRQKLNLRMPKVCDDCEKGLLEAISPLSTEECDINTLNTVGESFLHIACRNGHLNCVKTLEIFYRYIDLKNTKDGRNSFGDTALHLASYRKSINIVRILLEMKCSTNIPNKKGETAQDIPLNEDGDCLLHIACQWGDVDIVRYLITDERCNPNVQSYISGNTPLHIAAKYGQESAIFQLSSYRECNPNVQNKDGDTPLHLAASSNKTAVISKLLAHQQCDINAQNKKGNTPLHLACYKRSLEVVKVLLEMRCSTNIPNRKGETAQDIPLNEDGDCLLHIACQWGDVDIVRYLINDERCNPNVQNANLDTPLHIVCYSKSLDIIRFLLEKRCSTNIPDKKGETAQDIPLNEDGDCLLHIACQWDDVDIVRYLITDGRCNPNLQSFTTENTPLHIAVRDNRAHVISQLLADEQCNLNVQNNEGDTPLHIACYRKTLNIIKVLLKKRCSTNIPNTKGETAQDIPLNEDGDCLLHIACQWGDVDTIRYLITDERCNPNVQSYISGNTPLHIAAKYGKDDIIVQLLSCEECDPNMQNKEGDSPLHIAVRDDIISAISLLLTSKRCNPNVQNKDGDCSLHIAVCENRIPMISQLLANKQCNQNIWNNDYLTPLLIAINHKNSSAATVLLQHRNCDLTLCDPHGNTPLHLACIGGETEPEMVEVAKQLLTLTDVDPSCVNNAGQTPIELTTNYQLIQAISHFVKCKTKQSIQTYINIFIVGNPETGKSTLVKAICKEATSILWKFVPKQVRRVKNVPLHTAGIIPTTFQSKTFGNTVLYDLAGQVEYYTSHAAVIRSTVISTPPAFVIVVNLSESEEKISQTLRYWWSFIDNHAARCSAPPQVILVGSHADRVKSAGKSVKEKMTHISVLLKKLPAAFHFAGQVALDSRDPASRELQHFCSLVNQSCTVLRERADVDLRCHVLYAFLLDRFKDKVVCTVSDVATSVKETSELLPQSPDSLIPLISTLSDKGLLLLVRGSESPRDWWVILQKQALLGEINGVIFAPKNFRQYKDLSWSTGVVPFSKLKEEFPDYNPNMVSGFLTYLEFCFKIEDPKTVSLLKEEASIVEDISTSVEDTSPNVSEEYYFFPALVSVENPLHVWKENNDMCCKCGWLYKCIRHDQFLTTQFLHVLILRLAFTFALWLDPGDCHEDSLSLRRKCSVWKHGIAWLSRVPIETVVEVGLQYQSVVVMMRCPEGKEANCVQLCSEVIQKILEAKDEHCKAVKMSESFIYPTNVKYPFTDNMKDVKFYSLTEIARGIIYKGDALDRSGLNPTPVQDLLLFDPHATDMSPELLKELFSEKHSMNETVRSQVLETLKTTPQPVVIQDVESEASIPAITKKKAEGRGTVHDLSSQHCTKPTLPELLKFTCTDQRVVNIPVKIATKYVQFGTFLLDDETGSRVKIMAHKHLNNAEEINTEILKEWLTGRGKQPVTWATLVEVLCDIELSALASEIEAVKCPAGLGDLS